MATIETYTQTDIAGQTFTYDLDRSEEGRWSVNCWKHTDEAGDTGDGFDHHWESRGVTIEVRGHSQRQTPHTEETARAEFERWRAIK